MTKTPARLYQALATAEMITWAGLITAMILRYGFAMTLNGFSSRDYPTASSSSPMA